MNDLDTSQGNSSKLVDYLKSMDIRALASAYTVIRKVCERRDSVKLDEGISLPRTATVYLDDPYLDMRAAFLMGERVAFSKPQQEIAQALKWLRAAPRKWVVNIVKGPSQSGSLLWDIADPEAGTIEDWELENAKTYLETKLFERVSIEVADATLGKGLLMTWDFASELTPENLFWQEMPKLDVVHALDDEQVRWLHDLVEYTLRRRVRSKEERALIAVQKGLLVWAGQLDGKGWGGPARVTGIDPSGITLERLFDGVEFKTVASNLYKIQEGRLVQPEPMKAGYALDAESGQYWPATVVRVKGGSSHGKLMVDWKGVKEDPTEPITSQMLKSPYFAIPQRAIALNLGDW